MQRIVFALALCTMFGVTGALAQGVPPCNAGTAGENVIPVQNGNTTYCVSDFGWSDTWMPGSPTRYNFVQDLLSGDDALNLKYNAPPGGFGPGSGWLSPALDEGTLTAQAAPGWSRIPALWTVTTPVHSTGPNSAQSVIVNPDGLEVTIDTILPMGSFGVQISVRIRNTSSQTITGLRLADYFNFHPNGSNYPNNLKGTTSFQGNCIVTTGEPIVLLDAKLCGLFAPARFEVGLATAGASPAVWQDVTNGTYNNFAGPVGPADSAGALEWDLGDLTPGASVRFALGKNVTPFIPPTISKSFINPGIPVNGTSALTFTIANSNGQPLTGVGFTDVLPSGVVVSSPNGISGTCGGGTMTAVAGGTNIALTGATLAASANCTFSVNVTSASGGVYINTTGPVSSNETGEGGTATATLTVAAPPVISKNFKPASIPTGGTSALTFIIQNPNAATQLTGVSFSDTLPDPLIIATPNGLTGACGSGAIIALVATNKIMLTNATLPAAGTCTFSVNVTAAVGGTYTNVSGPVTANESGPGNSATAILNVIRAPVISKNFTPASIPVKGISALSFTISNPNATSALTGIGFNDSLPGNVVIASPNGLTGSCGVGAISAPAGGSVISLSGTTLPPTMSCTFAVNVTSQTGGSYVNTTGPVTSTEAGNGNTAAATLSVVMPPVISKAFAAAVVPVNAISVLSITVHNPNADFSLSGIGFNDAFPADLTVATPNGLSGACGGGAISAPAGGSTVALAGAILSSGASCTISVNVISAVSGAYTNNTGPVTSNEGGPGSAASAILTVVAPPRITKAFSPSAILVNGASSLTFTITNPNGSMGLTGIGVNDPLPAGVQIASPNGATSNCGGNLVAPAGGAVISLSGAALAGGASCTFSVGVVGITDGTKHNVSGAVTSNEGGPGNTAIADLTVAPIGQQTISKAFNPGTIAVGGISILTFTLTNPVATGVTGVAFSDTLPAGVVVSTQGTVNSTCGSGITAAQGTNLISLTGGAIAANASCTISVTVSGTTAGVKNNVSGPITSTEGGTGNTASATLIVIAPPLISKAFSPAGIPAGGTSTLSLTVTNPNSFAALTGVSFTDTFPAGVTVGTPNGLISSCGGTVQAPAGSTGVSLSGASLPAGASCSISVNTTAAAVGAYVNTTSLVMSSEGGPGNAATATLAVVVPPSISKVFTPSSIRVDDISALSFTITNPNAGAALTGIAFADPLPGNVRIATPNGLTGACGGGTIAGTANTGTIGLSGATLAGGASCTFSVNVTSSTIGVYVNTTSRVSATESGAGNSASATLTVGVEPPLITKSFGQSVLGLNSTATLSFVITNPAGNPTLTQVAFVDPLPDGVVVGDPNGLTASCGQAAITALPGAASVSLSGATLQPGGTCTFQIRVLGVTAGPKVNTTGLVTSLEAPPGGPATANISIVDPYLITYESNLNQGDSTINITNTGASGAGLSFGTTASVTGALCANVYAFAPDEQLVSCCSCPVTPNGLVTLSANADLLSNVVSPPGPNSIVVKILASQPAGNTCNNSAALVSPLSLANGIQAFDTTLHQDTAGKYVPTEKPFSHGTLSPDELNRLTTLCNIIVANGSGYGVCRACRLGAQGGARQ